MIGRRVLRILRQNLPRPVSYDWLSTHSQALPVRLARAFGVWPKSSILSSGKLDVASYTFACLPKTETISVSNRLSFPNVNRPFCI